MLTWACGGAASKEKWNYVHHFALSLLLLVLLVITFLVLRARWGPAPESKKEEEPDEHEVVQITL